jgi:hypothetical protein
MMSYFTLLSALRHFNCRLLNLCDDLRAHCFFIISGSLNNDILIFFNLNNLNNLFLSFLNMNFFLYVLGFLILLDFLNYSKLLQSLLILMVNIAGCLESGIELFHKLGFFCISDCQPLFSVIAFIETLSNRAIRKDINSFIVLLALDPVTKVRTAVHPDIHTKPVLLVVLVLSVVHSTVGPLVSTLAMHDIIQPLANIDSSVGPNVDTVTRDHVIFPVTDVLVTVWPRVHASPFLLRFNVVTLELAAISP